jgi:hypothetical protein
MKNIITTIAIVLFIFSSVQLNAQYRYYRNVGIYLEQLLDSNDIFYVGIYDRALLSQNKESYVHKEYSDLVKFDSTIILPSCWTNRLVMLA